MTSKMKLKFFTLSCLSVNHPLAELGILIPLLFQSQNPPDLAEPSSHTASQNVLKKIVNFNFNFSSFVYSFSLFLDIDLPYRWTVDLFMQTIEGPSVDLRYWLGWLQELLTRIHSVESAQAMMQVFPTRMHGGHVESTQGLTIAVQKERKGHWHKPVSDLMIIFKWYFQLMGTGHTKLNLSCLYVLLLLSDSLTCIALHQIGELSRLVNADHWMTQFPRR